MFALIMYGVYKQFDVYNNWFIIWTNFYYIFCIKLLDFQLQQYHMDIKLHLNFWSISNTRAYIFNYNAIPIFFIENYTKVKEFNIRC